MCMEYFVYYEFERLDKDTDPASKLESGPFCNVKGTSVIENLDSVTFTCWVDLPDDAPGQLVWRNNGKEVARTQEKTNDYMKRVFDRSEDGDEYTCIFEYQNAYFCLELQSLNCSEEFIIDVQYPPDVSLRNAVGPSVAVIEGESYTNFCIVYSNPSATVEWIHGGKVVENYGLLDLQNVQRYQNGTYTCHANTTFWNSDSGSGSLSFKLDVQYSPEISLVGANDDVVEGSTYSRVCSVESNPSSNCGMAVRGNHCHRIEHAHSVKCPPQSKRDVHMPSTEHVLARRE
ncbi:Schwann cell myelin protein-like [Ptychodera flava]|uniref:Schwann cell myelin protein-like n=1 Tax=Ptychodera flava TaxID=63121 RepID=UPI00396A53DC